MLFGKLSTIINVIW